MLYSTPPEHTQSNPYRFLHRDSLCWTPCTSSSRGSSLRRLIQGTIALLHSLHPSTVLTFLSPQREGHFTLHPGMACTYISVSHPWQFSLWALPGAYSLAASLALYPLGASTTAPVLLTKRFRHFWWPWRAKIALIASHCTVWSSATIPEALANNSLLIPAKVSFAYRNPETSS